MTEAKKYLESVWEDVRKNIDSYKFEPAVLVMIKGACLAGYSHALSFPTEFPATGINDAIVEILTEELARFQ